MAEGVMPRRVPFEALALALRHSRASALATDALIDVLLARYHDIVSGDTLDLEPVWELLASQPEFVEDAVTPAIARFRSWEPRLGLTVLLPRGMRDLSEAQLGELAGGVHVPAKELARVWRGGTQKIERLERAPGAGDAQAPPRSQRVTQPPPPRTAKQKKIRRPLTRTQRRGFTIAAAVVALAGFVFAGKSLAG